MPAFGVAIAGASAEFQCHYPDCAAKWCAGGAGLLARRPRAGDNTSRLRAFGFNREPATPWLCARGPGDACKSLKSRQMWFWAAIAQARQKPDPLQMNLK
jgi:hypothetical protein